MAELNNLNQPYEASCRKFFSVSEANRALVLVKRIVADIVVHYKDLLEAQETFDASEYDCEFEQAQIACDRVNKTADKIRLCLDELELIGVILCDWHHGVVDFPAVLNGRQVSLCWYAGESKVEYWHENGCCNHLRNHVSVMDAHLQVAG